MTEPGAKWPKALFRLAEKLEINLCHCDKGYKKITKILDEFVLSNGSIKLLNHDQEPVIKSQKVPKNLLWAGSFAFCSAGISI